MEFTVSVQKATCPECGEKIIGRRDKKFCSDQCRTAHFNKLNCDQNKCMKNINNILRQNRRILQNLKKGKATKISKLKLLSEGYKFPFLTEEFVTRSGKTIKFCYDYGYSEDENNMITIVNRNNL
ncbi:MAG: hypothetical protein IPN49_01545 [Saprospiraceae bacterium]|nr:hypothetical protein [Saprospiraceae bacterium]MBK6565695.1 hypothetical protein [Saprospiraceae bacterium]MBK6784661.1 hypothetical protein [Saprospiraceae bacterium]MBK7525273.1 hypothetical protein [Saprospiraceae bacterium]MBK8082115.1 hypothetical protein [Saprospiraceae bacterium]